MVYRHLYTSRAELQLSRLSRRDQERIFRRVQQIAEEPRGHQSKQLKGRPVRWTARVGQLRIVYAIDDASEEIIVHGVGNRGSIYEQMRRRS